MISNLNEKPIVLEIQELIKGVETAKEEINLYCDLMKQIFLAGSQKN